MNAVRLFAAMMFVGFALVAFAPAASAHASMNTADGKYRITWGLLDEPGFTFSKNGLDLIIRELAPTATNANATGAGVSGLTAANLTVQLKYLDEVYEWGNISQNTRAKGSSFAGSVAPNGNYTAANGIVLTQAGIYTLVIKGDIRGTPVDLAIPAAHDYEPIGEIMFPREVELGAEPVDTAAWEARVAALEQKVAALEAKTATQAATPAQVITQTPGGTTPATDGSAPAPGLGLALVALAIVGSALLLRRRSK